jgi:ATP-dependent Clp protease ATP-binding subunit ClpC
MVSLSLGVHISFELATYETLAMRHEFILPEFIFAGITKLQDLITEEFLVELDTSVRNSFRNEVQVVLQALEEVGVDVRKARRTTRVLVGDGRYKRQSSDILHRTPELREAFQKASTMAEEAGYDLVGVNHLLIAVLEIPDTILNVVFQVFDTTPDDVLTRIRQVKVDPTPVPEQNEERLSEIPRNHTDAERDADAPAISPASILDEFGMDLVEMARKGAISDVFERDDEILKIITTLSRSQNNNPVLIGDPGVGKTAIVEGLAYRIANRLGVPVDFFDKRIIQVDIARVVGGTKYRGMFEERLVNIIEKAKSDPNIILFVDEIHMLVGAGATSNSPMDAGNMLKHAMSRPNFSLIGATTTNEYNSFIDRDRALERRFTPITIREPSASTTMRILLAGLDPGPRGSH